MVGPYRLARRFTEWLGEIKPRNCMALRRRRVKLMQFYQTFVRPFEKSGLDQFKFIFKTAKWFRSTR